MPHDEHYIDTYIARRTTLIAAWEQWDEAPGHDTRAHAFADALIDYAGQAHVQLAQFAMAKRRAGHSYTETLDLWENDW